MANRGPVQEPVPVTFPGDTRSPVSSARAALVGCLLAASGLTCGGARVRGGGVSVPSAGPSNASLRSRAATALSASEPGASREPANCPDSAACALSGEQDRQQAEFFPEAKGQSGVCWAGACLPRARCLSECVGDYAAKHALELARRTEDCRRKDPDPSACRLQSFEFSDLRSSMRALDGCSASCGFRIMGFERWAEEREGHAPRFPWPPR